MKERIELTVEPRTTGKHNSRGLRKEKKIPAVVYGATKNTSICLHENLIKKYNTRAYENALFNLKCSDSTVNNSVVLMKDVSIHPVSQKPLHVDFFAIDPTKTIRVFIEVKLEGKPIGIADGGLLNIITREVEVECLPISIPESINVDISNLGVGQAIHVSDLKLPQDVKIISLGELTVAVVNKESERAETAATPTAEAGAAAATPAAAAAKGAPAAKGAAPAAAAKGAPAAKAAAPKKADKK
jgi:large subunit ribosomal protein L25